MLDEIANLIYHNWLWDRESRRLYSCGKRHKFITRDNLGAEGPSSPDQICPVEFSFHL